MLSINPVTLLENPKAKDANKAKIPMDETMGNQQATREEIGWLAGIIDGEGYLGFNYNKDKRKKRGDYVFLTPCLHISNTDEEIVLKSRDIVRKLGVNPYIRATKATKQVRKDQYRIQIHHMAKMKIILDIVLPYLTGIKKKRAELILEFIELRKSASWIWTKPNNPTNQGGASKPYSEREWQIYHECKAIQKRGASETIRRAQRSTSEIWTLMQSRQLEVVKG